MRLKPAIVLLPLLLGTWGTTNYHMTCWFQQKPREWYVKRTMWFNKQALGIPLGSPDEVLEAWIRNHPDCCFVKPTNLNPVSRIIFGSDYRVMIFYRELKPYNPDRPYATQDWVLSPCGFLVERLRRVELKADAPKFPDAPFDSNEPWRVRL